MSEIMLGILSMPDELFWDNEPLARLQHNEARKEAAKEIVRLRADADRLASALYGIVGIEPGEDTEAFCNVIELAAPSKHEKTIALNAVAALKAHEALKRPAISAAQGCTRRSN